MNRRHFLKQGALISGALSLYPIYSGRKFLHAQTDRDLVFRPYPHPWMPAIDFFYATDQNEDPFRCPVEIKQEGIRISREATGQRFAVNTRWFVDGFGFVTLTADNAGQLYSVSDGGKEWNLNYEFARSRVFHFKQVVARYRKAGSTFSSEVTHLQQLAEDFLESATSGKNKGEKCARLSDQSLNYALWAGEKLELEQARQQIVRKQRLEQVFFGCESRQYIWAKSEPFVQRFTELLNFATITHYVWDSWYELFEPQEGQYNWGIKDNIVNWLLENNITIQGRPLFWFHPVVTPEWLKNKNFEQLKKYVEQHTTDLVSHYGNKVLQWEVVNEYHDWANIHNHTPEEITEIVRLACDKTREVNPQIVRILNNCYPWAEYVARGRMARMDAARPLRTPRQFLQDLINAGVNFEVLGIQIYFPQRDHFQIVRLLERLEKLGKPIYITEIGASSNPFAANPSGAQAGSARNPYDWHRFWDEELQADWLEQVYTLYYSRPSIQAINWYDFSDFRPFIVNGGLITESSEAKPSYHRLKNLLKSWDRLPVKS